MADEIEVVSDGEGVVVAGENSVIARFVRDLGLHSDAHSFDLSNLKKRLKVGADLAETFSSVAEQSAMYLKLTPESAKGLQDAGGLMKTKTKGISHAMLGKTGDASLKWLQVQDGPASLLTNPVVLSGIGGLMSQAAHQAEAQELKALLTQIDEKLDDVRRRQKGEVLARLRTAAAAINDAMTIHGHGGDPKTIWDTVSNVKKDITNVQEDALDALEALAGKVEKKNKSGELKKVTHEIEQEVALQLAILTRCFELYDQFRIVELDHVFATNPDRLEGHRAGLAESRCKRQTEVLQRTGRLMEQMDRAGEIVNANVILHGRATRAVVGSLNATAEVVIDFHRPLGIETPRESLTVKPLREALRDREQLQAAGKEAAGYALKGGGAVLGLAVMSAVAVVAKNGDKPAA